MNSSARRPPEDDGRLRRAVTLAYFLAALAIAAALAAAWLFTG